MRAHESHLERFREPHDEFGVPYPGYQVGDHGRIISHKRGTPVALKPSVNKDEYRSQSLSRGNAAGSGREWIHVLVDRMFNPPSDDPTKTQVDHRNSDKSCSAYWNLERVTPSENIKRMHASGKRKQPQRRLTESDAVEIRRLHLEGITKTALAKQYGVERQTIADLIRFDTFPNEGCSLPPVKLTNVRIFLSRVWMALGIPVSVIAEGFGISRRVILRAHERPDFVEFWHKWLRYIATGDPLPTWGEPHVDDSLVRAYVARVQAGMPLNKIVPLPAA